MNQYRGGTVRIPVNYSKSSKGESIFVTARLLAPHVSGYVDLIVDTGCPFSFIGAIDVEKLNIKVAGKRPVEDIQWGDKILRFFPFHGSELWFRAENDGVEKPHVIRHKKLRATLDFVAVKERKDSPNVLGMDFLSDNNLQLVVDGKTKSAWFEA